MSAAANAAGYLYAHRLLPGTAQAEPRNVARRPAPQPERSNVAAEPQADKRPQPRAPRIEYRKRRVLMREAA
jgi:hypothetical protein